MKILITGATSGIGFDLAKALERNNHMVYITTHKKEQLEEVSKRIEKESLSIYPYKMDIRKEKDRKLVRKINPDVLINHAGIGNGGSILDIDIEVLKDSYEINIFASFSLLKEFYDLKLEKEEQGKIFVTSSVASMLPIPFLGCYTSSKAAISMLVKTLQLELKSRNSKISISLIEPGAYHTGFNQVMIDNKQLYTKKSSKIYKNIPSMNRIQRNMFALIEKENTISLVKKVAKEIEKENPKFLIRKPMIQGIMAKITLLFYR